MPTSASDLKISTSSWTNTLDEKYHSLAGAEYRQTNENDRAKIVLVHEPDMPIFMGALHPDGSLYENPVDLKKAQREHRHLVEVLEKAGISVVRVRDLLRMDCEENLKERLKLENLAMKCLTYKFDEKEGVDQSLLSDRDRYLMSNEYKEKTISEVNVDQLIDIILTNPTIYLRKADINTALSSTSITFSPLSNLVFCRDQQITTPKGIIMGQLNSKTRENEIAITKFCFQKLGCRIAGDIPLPGKLEGGDFFPLGESLCMIGVGLRTNMFAVHYCMDNDLFGTHRVAVVKDCFDWHQERMHLDTIFNIVSEKACVLLDTVIGESSSRRRLVDVYERRPGNQKGYHLVLHDIEFSRYLSDHLNFLIIPLTEADQANYGLNFLNLGNGHIVSPDMASARKIAKSTESGIGKIEVIDYGHVSNMYGSIHCSTQVISRQPYTSPSVGATDGHGSLVDKEAVPGTESTSTSSSVVHSGSGDVFPPIAPNTVHPQNTHVILMVPPSGFFFNPQAATDNTFMKTPLVSKHAIQRSAMEEYSHFHAMLTRDFGISVHLALNDRLDTPDSVYPNNWFSTHPPRTPEEEPTLVIYPMKHENRRLERIPETIRRLSQKFTRIVDYTSAEEIGVNGEEPRYLEGTGVFVLDRIHRVAYLCESPRADPSLAKEWCARMGYELFDCGVAVDKHGEPVYHTNVVMGIGAKVAIVCLSAISNAQRREQFVKKLSQTHEIIDISFEQMHHFCGNVIELWSPKHNCPVMIMSDQAHSHFTPEQLEVLQKNGVLVGHAGIPTIERYGGGGVRCCIAEIF